MGIHVIKMPDIGEGIAEVELVAWRVQPGETVTEDQILADVMTDKATVEIPSPVSGTVQSHGGTVGQVMAVGSELIRLEVEGEGNLKAGTPAPVAPASRPRALHRAMQRHDQPEQRLQVQRIGMSVRSGLRLGCRGRTGFRWRAGCRGRRGCRRRTGCRRRVRGVGRGLQQVGGHRCACACFVRGSNCDARP